MVALINKWIRNQAVHIITKNESYPGFEAVEAAELSALVYKKKKIPQPESNFNAHKKNNQFPHNSTQFYSKTCKYKKVRERWLTATALAINFWALWALWTTLPSDLTTKKLPFLSESKPQYKQRLDFYNKIK